MPQIQTTVSDTTLSSLKERANRAGTSLSGLVSSILSDSQGETGFIGVSIRYAGDSPDHGEGRWVPVALDGLARIDSGALVIESGSGAILHAFAPGYWREASRRVESDRHLFRGGATLLE